MDTPDIRDRVMLQSKTLLGLLGARLTIGTSFAYVDASDDKVSAFLQRLGQPIPSKPRFVIPLTERTRPTPGALVRPLRLPSILLASITADKGRFRFGLVARVAVRIE